MFGYDSITVSYARELISVSMCYSQGDGFKTSMSRFMYCTHDLLPGLSYSLLCIVLGVVIFGGIVMCYPGRR